MRIWQRSRGQVHFPPRTAAGPRLPGAAPRGPFLPFTRSSLGVDGLLNRRMSARQLRLFCQFDEEGRTLLKMAMEKLGLSARAHDRILCVARTIADLKADHVVEGVSCRFLDRKLWTR